MKILFLTPWACACGIATYAENLIKELEKLGVNVEVFSDTSNFNRLVKLAKDAVCDVVHIQHEFGISLTPEAFLSLLGKFRISGKPVVVTTHTEKDEFNVLLDGAADTVILHNDPKDLTHKSTFSNFVKIPHGIPEISFDHSKKHYRAKYDVPRGMFVIGTCGFLTTERGQFIESLIDRLSDFLGKHKDIYFYIATSTHRHDSDGQFSNMIKSSILSLAAKHHFNDRIYVETEFMDTQTFRERLYMLDLGFSYGSSKMISNSGAAADIVSCKVPVVVNDVPHFSHIRPYCVVAENSVDKMAEKIVEIYEKREDAIPQLTIQAEQAVKDLGYSVAAKRHVEIYKELVSKRQTGKPVAMTSAPKTLSKDKPVTITCANELWQILLLWKKLNSLVKDGHIIRLLLQSDGLTDSAILKFVVDGLQDIQFEDVGLQHDSRLVRLHSRSLAQNMTTDVRAWLAEGNSFADLFNFIPETKFHMNLGEYAQKRAAKVVGEGKVCVVHLSNDKVVTEFEDLIGDPSIFSKIILLGSPINRKLVDRAYKRLRANNAIVDKEIITKVVEDTRTRWAVCRKAAEIITGWDEVAAFNLIYSLPTIYVVESAWQRNLIKEIGTNYSIYGLEK